VIATNKVAMLDLTQKQELSPATVCRPPCNRQRAHCPAVPAKPNDFTSSEHCPVTHDCPEKLPLAVNSHDPQNAPALGKGVRKEQVSVADLRPQPPESGIFANNT